MRKILIPLFLTALLFSVACGDDDGGGDTAAGDSSGGDSGGADDFCGILLELDQAQDPTDDLDENATEQDVEEALRTAFEDLGVQIDDLRDAAPDEIKDDVNTVADAVESFVDGGSLEELSSDEEVTAASTRLDEFEAANCGPDPDGEGE
jgi:hypothetical protein